MVVDELARRLDVSERDWKTKDNARAARVPGRDLMLVEPQSFMNESGVPARLVAARYKVPNDRILVVYDELDLPFGRLRMRERGSSAGHNGMKSIIGYFGVEIPRLRIGIGREGADDAIGRVLARFTQAERKLLPRVIGVAADAAMRWAAEGFTAASNLANAWRLEEEVSNPGASAER
jgi:PTH1 family peptidyl-tRNA hydrolase